MNTHQIRFLPLTHFAIAALVVTGGASFAGCKSDRPEPVLTPESSTVQPEVSAPVEVAVNVPEVVEPVEQVVPVVPDFSGNPHEGADGLACDVDHLSIAQGLVESELFTEAIEELERGVFDDPTGFETRRSLGELYKSRGHLELAVGHLRAALEEVDDSTTTMSLAQVYFDLKDYDATTRTITKGVKLDPTSPEPYRLLARVYQSKAMWKESIDALEEAIARGSDSPWTYNNLGFAHLILGNSVDAVRELEKAVSYDTDVTPQIWNNLGLAYEKNTQIVDAAGAYRAALEGNPTYVKAKVNLNRIVAVAEAEGIPLGDRTAEVAPDRQE